VNAWGTMTYLQKTVDDFQLGPLDLSFETGTITALIGNNGSGKSTLLKLMMNLVKPDQGNVHLFGESVESPEKNWKPHVAYLPQSPVGANMFTGEALRNLTAGFCSDWDETLFKYMVKAFNIPLNKKYSKLSPGVQQKLNLALTVPRNASVMILDEPTSYLDIPSTKMLGDILTDCMDQGERFILLTSHQVEDVRKLSDYIAILHDGELLGSFEKGALQERFRRYWITTELPNEKVPGEVSREEGRLVTDDAARTEAFFEDAGVAFFDQKALDLEDIITLLMTEHKNWDERK